MKRTRGRLDRNVAPFCTVCPIVHAQTPYPRPQSGIRALIKQGWWKRNKAGKTEVRRMMERKTAQQIKNLSEEIKQGLPAQLRLTNKLKQRLTSPSHRMRPPALFLPCQVFFSCYIHTHI